MPAVAAKCCGVLTNCLRRRLPAVLFLLMFEPDHKPLTAPKLNVVPVDKLPGFFDGFGIVRASQRLNSNEMPVGTDDVSAILLHPENPYCRMDKR
jgi:hypothetical protein